MDGRSRATPMRSGVKAFKAEAERLHGRIPWIRRLPAPAVAIVLTLCAVQVVVWIAVGIVLHFHTALVSTAVLSYTLGLRHALDADHISAIDLMTRRLVASGQRPVTVGTFFSLGHSTIVIVTSIVVAASSAAIRDRFGAFSNIGSIIGSAVSAAFLIILGIMNAYIFHKLLQQLRRAIATPRGHETSLDLTFQGAGCMTMMLRKAFTLVDRPWKMYPLGVLFGLGFDTSSEIALLGISSIEAAHGTSFWLILLFPVLFTAAMCLLDSLDGAAMMSLYTAARLAQDAIAVLYYQCVLTAITVAVAGTIGVIQLLSLILNVRPDLVGDDDDDGSGSGSGGGGGSRFWRGVEVAGDHYDVIGGAICAAFVVLGGLSVLLYQPWRRRVDRKRAVAAAAVAREGRGSSDGEHGLVEELTEIPPPPAPLLDGQPESVQGRTSHAHTKGKVAVRVKEEQSGESSRTA